MPSISSDIMTRSAVIATLSMALPGYSVKLPVLEPGCKKGSNYVNAPTYGVSSSQWGHLPRGGWRGAVLGPSGGKIYGIPTNASSVLEIDPTTRTVSTFGNLGDSHSDVQCSGSLHCGEEKWIGGVLVPSSGKIIGIPYAAETVLEIDPAARTTTTFGIVSSSVKRKWVDGVLGRNGLIYAIPYDADVVLEIDPDSHALMLFGRVGGDPCKWYGGVLGPNDKIYTIPYSSPYVLEIDPERRIARPFAMTYPHWAKWSGGVLAPNGKIYGIPALSKSVLEIDVEREQTSLFGMLPGGNDLQDKWAGGVLAPNGRIYGMPWKSSSVLEFDPTTKAIALLGSGIGAANYSWSGGALAQSGRIVAVPYNGAYVLEIGESVCNQAPAPPAPTANAAATKEAPKGVLSTPNNEINGLVVREQKLENQAPLPSLPTNVVQTFAGGKPGPGSAAGLTFVLALLGCPDAAKASEDACFHLSHRTWHSAMVTIMPSEVTLHDIREQVTQSRLSHVPTNFCFLFNGHALDPNVEQTIKAATVAILSNPPDSQGAQYIVLIDNVHCNIGPKTSLMSIIVSPAPSFMQLLTLMSVVCTISFFAFLTIHHRTQHLAGRGGPHYDRVPSSAQEAQALIDVESNKAARTKTKRIPCLPDARFRPLFEKTTRARVPSAKPVPSPKTVEHADGSGAEE